MPRSRGESCAEATMASLKRGVRTEMAGNATDGSDVVSAVQIAASDLPKRVLSWSRVAQPQSQPPTPCRRDWQ